jgi:hypothetical protein
MSEIEFEGAPKKKPIRLGTTQHIDAETGEVVKEEKNSLMMLGPGPGVCQECAVDHPHDQPHNRDSLTYQYTFYAKHGRWPTWSDAMAHCPYKVQLAWKVRLVEMLRELGREVPDDLLHGTGGATR